MRSTVLEIPLYGGSLVVVESAKWKDVKRKYKLKGSFKSFGAVTLRHVFKNGTVHYVMAFPEKLDLPAVAHECVHFVNYLFVDRHIQLSRRKDEPQAYITGWAFEQAFNFLTRK